METVRNGQRVWPFCSECGCRLEIFENNIFVTLRHFWGNQITQDARGCRCSKINLEWSLIKGEITHLGYC